MTIQITSNTTEGEGAKPRNLCHLERYDAAQTAYRKVILTKKRVETANCDDTIVLSATDKEGSKEGSKKERTALMEKPQ